MIVLVRGIMSCLLLEVNDAGRCFLRADVMERFSSCFTSGEARGPGQSDVSYSCTVASAFIMANHEPKITSSHKEIGYI